MQKAIFAKKQNAVLVEEVESGTQYTICLNETPVVTEFQFEEAFEITQYQYDFNQFIDSNIKQDDVKAHPEEYLEYIPKVETKDQESEDLSKRIEALEKRQNDSDQALQDLICTFMGE